MYYLENAPMSSTTAMSIHTAMLVLVLTTMGLVWWRSRCAPNSIEAALWPLGAIILSIAFGFIQGDYPEYDVSFINFYIAVVWIVAIFGGLLSYIRTRTKPVVPVATGEQLATAGGCVLALLLLLAFFSPAVRRGAGEAVYRTQCKNNLKQIGLGIHNYLDAYDTTPVAIRGEPPYSWRVGILPFMEQTQLYNRYNFSHPWNVAENRSIAQTRVRDYTCPSRIKRNPAYEKDQEGRFYSHYAMPVGTCTVARGVNLNEISDGTSSTLLVVEACGMNILWTEPRDVDTTDQPVGINLPSPTKGMSPGWISGQHSGGAQVLLADGSVRFLSAKTSEETLKSLMTIDAKDHVGNF